MLSKVTVDLPRPARANLWLILFILLWPGFSWSQAEEAGTIPGGSGGFAVISYPAGATVHLSGEYDLVATTPFLVRRQLVGTYSLEATKPGYETYSRKLSFPPGTHGRLTINLKSRTGLKAAWRSMFLPGWGQFYSGEKTRGVVISSLGFGAILTTIVAELRYQNRYDEYREALSDYQGARGIEEKNQLKIALEDKHQRARDAETLKLNLLVMTALIWGYNVVDAYLFFPDQKVDLQVGDNLSLKEGELTVKLCKRF